MEPRVLRYDDRGAGEAVILVPGGLTGWLSWIPHQERLVSRYRAIRVGGVKAVLEFATEYPERVDTLTLIEPAAYWILEQIGEQAEVLEELNRFLHPLYGRRVTDDDLATFLEYAGFVTTRSEARSHPNWGRWVPHRMALSWQSEAVDHPDRAVDDLARVSCPTLLVKGTVTADWLKRVVDVLGGRLPDATVEELPGSHACHIESIEQFMDALDRHLQR